jgi:hypothetical protein
MHTKSVKSWGFLGSTRNAFLRPVSISAAAPACLDS